MLPPHLYQPALEHFGREAPIRILDVGCGNNSPSRARFYFPNCIYHGVDIQEYNINEADKAIMSRFFLVNPNGSGYEQIPDGSYDLVICNHIIEHIVDPYPVIRELCKKVGPDGYFWIAFPSVRSLSLPSAEGTLQFCDDPTHVFLPSLRDIVNILLSERLMVKRAGRTTDTFRWAKGALEAAVQNLRALFGKRRRSTGKNIWHYYGFEDSIVAQRPRPR